MTFSEAMDPQSLSASAFTLTAGGQAVAGSVTPYEALAVFRPDVDLALDTLYTATVSTGVADASGLAMTDAYSWDFATGPSLDEEAPRVTFTEPADLDIDVALSTLVHVGFNEAMDPSTLSALTLTVTPWGETTALNGVVTYDSALRVATFTPDSELEPETTYTGLVSDAAADLAGNQLAADYAWTFTTEGLGSIWVPVELGSLTTFVAVAGAGLTNSNSGGTTTLNGDVGLSPTGTCLGDGVTCSAINPIINGTLFAADADGVAARAKTDLTAAYIDAMGRPIGTIVNDVSGMTLPPGVYTSSSTMGLAVGATLTLDAQGDANAVWIFQVGSSLTVNNDAQVVLINEARASNVFWGVYASSTLGSNVSFQGTVLAQASNSVGTGSDVVGRLLCTTGQITLLANLLTLGAASCLAAALASPPAQAQAVQLHVEPAAALWVDSPQSERFGPGLYAAVRPSVMISPMFGVQWSYALLAAPAGDGWTEDGAAHFLTTGVRLRPLAPLMPEERQLGGLFIDGNVGYVRTGDLNRMGLDVGLGYGLQPLTWMSLGPVIRYVQVVQPDRLLDVDQSDAQLLTIGLDVGFGRPHQSAPPATSCPDEVSCPEPERVPISVVEADPADCRDGDHDGVCDSFDRCPTVIGPLTTLGCPIDPCSGAPLVVLVQFNYDSVSLPVPRVDDPQTMDPVLDAVAKAIAQDPSCRVCIVGHASEEGPAAHNMTLSRQRASAVEGYLSARGLAEDRMPTTGMGEQCSLVPAASLELNRRVEFLRLQEGESCPTSCMD